MLNASNQEFFKQNMEDMGFCSANFYILTISDNQQLNETYRMGTEVALYVSSLYFNEINMKKATIGESLKLRDKYSIELKREFEKNKGLTKETWFKIGQCETFLQGLLSDFEASKKVLNSLNENKSLKDEFLNVMALSNQETQELDQKGVLELYKKWIDAGALTHTEFKEKLKQSIEKPNK